MFFGLMCKYILKRKLLYFVLEESFVGCRVLGKRIMKNLFIVWFIKWFMCDILIYILLRFLVNFFLDLEKYIKGFF